MDNISLIEKYTDDTNPNEIENIKNELFWIFVKYFI